MFAFSIAESDGKKYNTLKEVLEILKIKLKHVTNKSLYSLEREIFEADEDEFFIVHDESTNTQKHFSLDIFGVSDSNGKRVYMYDFLKKYNYPKEIYDKDIKDYEEELQYQVKQPDIHQIASFTVLDGRYTFEFKTKKELITYFFEYIVDIESTKRYRSYSKNLQIKFNDFKIKINYQDKEIIFRVQMPCDSSPFILFVDSNYDSISIEDFLTKFYIDETEEYTIEDLIKQKEECIYILTDQLNTLEKKHYHCNWMMDIDDGYLDNLFQWH